MDDQPVGKDTPQQAERSEGPTTAEANLMFAKKLIASGEVRKAMKLLEEAVEQAPGAESLLLLAQLEIERPQSQPRALEHLKRAVEIEPRCTQAWLILANHWGVRGQPEKQQRCLEKILAYEPSNRDARDALEMILLKR